MPSAGFCFGQAASCGHTDQPLSPPHRTGQPHCNRTPSGNPLMVVVKLRYSQRVHILKSQHHGLITAFFLTQKVLWANVTFGCYRSKETGTTNRYSPLSAMKAIQSSRQMVSGLNSLPISQAETKFVRNLIQVRVNGSEWPVLKAEDLLSSLLLSLAPSFEYASQAECRPFAPGLGASQFRPISRSSQKCSTNSKVKPRRPNQRSCIMSLQVLLNQWEGAVLLFSSKSRISHRLLPASHIRRD